MSPIDTVICVHGIWSHGVGMYLIKRHLEREFGMRTLIFNYASVTNTLDENAGLLARFIDENELEQTHFVGHSLGGLVTLRMFARGYSAVPGRIVCLGSPLSGSRAAEFLHAREWGEHLLGHSLPAGAIHGKANEWASRVCDEHDVGSIAGSLPVGVGQIAGGFGEPNDGTVTVRETHLDGEKDHITLSVTHMGFLISRAAADQAGAFLRRGRFLREDD